MLLQNRVLDEHGRIVLLLGNKHPHYVSDQVRSAFWHTVQKHRLLQRNVLIVLVQLIERISLRHYPRHDSLPGLQKNVPANAGTLSGWFTENYSMV
jgi:calcineurin-like phosphoesterase family protein